MKQQDKNKIITIAGRPGSGKSTAAKAVAEALGYAHFSSGDLFRQISKEQGVDVLQANLAAETESKTKVPNIDFQVDERLRQIAKTNSEFVIDSRMAWHWMPNSFKVFLDLDLETAAERILSTMTSERIEAEHIPEVPSEYALALEDRLASEARRYKKIYDVNPYDTTNYDIVINTKTHTIEQVIELILKDYQYFSEI